MKVSRAFDQLVGEYLTAWLRLHPVEALEGGQMGAAERLPPLGDDEIAVIRVLDDKLVAALETVDERALDPERRLDLRLLERAGRWECERLGTWDWRHREPAAFVPVGEIRQLFVRPVDDLARGLVGRLEALPARLRAARCLLSETPELVWRGAVESAIEECRRGENLFRDLHEEPRIRQLRQVRGRLDSLLEQGVQALEECARFLERELLPRSASSPDYGPACLGGELYHRAFIEAEPPCLEAMFDRAEDLLHEELVGVAGELGENPAALIRQLGSDRDAVCLLPDTLRAWLRETRHFLETRLSLPEEWHSPRVEEGVGRSPDPVSPLHYVPPTPVAARCRATLYVALDEAHRFTQAEWLHALVSRGWPGAHLLALRGWSGSGEGGIVRRFFGSPVRSRSWGHAAERMMHEIGYFRGVGDQVVWLRNRLWVLERARADLAIHVTGEVFEGVAARLAGRFGWSGGQLLPALWQVGRRPGEAVAEAVEMLLLEALSRCLGPVEWLRRLPDLLAGGNLPLPLLIPRLFGERTWRAVALEAGLEESTSSVAGDGGRR